MEPLSERSVSAIIAAASVEPGIAARPQSIRYWGDIHTPEGTIENVELGRPAQEIWDASGPWVYPLAIGTRIFGIRRGTGDVLAAPSEIDWQYAERPKMRLCQ